MIDLTGQIIIAYGDGTGGGSTDRRSCVSSSAIPFGEWVHVSAIQDGPLSGRIYINGIQVPVTYNGSGSTTIVHDFSGRQVIGWQESYVPGYYMNGEIDEMRIWRTARTEEEIRANMCRKLSGTETGLESYWRFDEGAGTTVADLSGSGHNGTFVGAMTWNVSGAPLGDTSVYTYPASWLGETLTLEGPGPEQITASDVTAPSGHGIHLYRVDEAPNDLSGLPPGTPEHYYGVFATASSSTYTVQAILPDSVCSLCTIDWLSRNDNAAGPWFPLAGTPSASGCSRTKSDESSVGDSRRAEYAWADTSVLTAFFVGDTIYDNLCEGDSVFFEGSWLSTTGIYPWIIAGISGCDTLIWYSLNVGPILSEDTVFTTICEGDSVLVEGNWLSIAGLYPIELDPEECMAYWYSLDIDPCPDDTLPSEPGDTCILALPNAFSPNADGLNDEFGIPKAIVCPDLTYFYLVIYNRWGQVVWATSNPDIRWDGTFRGEDQELGVYVWVLQHRQESTPSLKQLSGTVTLIR